MALPVVWFRHGSQKPGHGRTVTGSPKRRRLGIPRSCHMDSCRSALWRSHSHRVNAAINVNDRRFVCREPNLTAARGAARLLVRIVDVPAERCCPRRSRPFAERLSFLPSIDRAAIVRKRSWDLQKPGRRRPHNRPVGSVPQRNSRTRIQARPWPPIQTSAQQPLMRRSQETNNASALCRRGKCAVNAETKLYV